MDNMPYDVVIEFKSDIDLDCWLRMREAQLDDLLLGRPIVVEQMLNQRRKEILERFIGVC